MRVAMPYLNSPVQSLEGGEAPVRVFLVSYSVWSSVS